MKIILLVEDQPIQRECLEEILKGAGYDVDVARDGVEATQLTDQNFYDLVLSDNGMPRKSGVELLRDMRKVGDKTPFILHSAGSDEALPKQCMQFDAIFIHKSAPVDELLALIAHTLQAK